MLNKYKGCLLGAVLGDALGMPYETGPARRGAQLQPPVFGRAYHGHPNHVLLPGQYTDDGQIILIVSRILAAGRFNGEEYAKELLRAYSLKKFRYPDGTVYAACKKMESSKNLLGSGISSDSAGCMALAIPFALRFRDRKEMARELLGACSITHTHPAAQAATLGFALLLNKLIETGDVSEAFSALDTAALNMDADLSSRLRNAYRFEGAGMSIEEAAAVIGTASSVYHTLPMAVFLCKRCYAPAELY
ncbi:MAG: ADP-ribosylglycohydrolase family protein, partial [Methanocorpusculum sp.]|nr:ADP-ribosylglycohydrolase family protein [Methanocorpusculum sp.]